MIEDPGLAVQQAKAQEQAPQGAPPMPPPNQGPGESPVPVSKQELAQMAMTTIRDLKQTLVDANIMVQWEADHFFENVIKHLNGV